MNDPLNDPNHPDRPSHPDFWRLSESILKMEGDVGEGGKEIPETMEGIVDITSLVYLTRQQTAPIFQNLLLLGESAPELAGTVFKAAIEAAMMTGVLLGIHFQKAGGHRD